MVDISGKIAFDFHLNTNLDKSTLKKQPIGKTMHDVDGEFQIFIDDEAYFDEKEFLLLEFGILLKKWVTKINNGKTEDFIYNSIEHDSPILEFRSTYGTWEVFSDWRISDNRFFVLSDNLVDSCRKFLDELEEKLTDTYEITLNTGIL